MLYPSIQDLTDNKVNRYMLVIAAAKSARYVTYKTNLERDAHKEGEKTVSIEESCKKSVSVAVDKLHNGQFKIVTE